ncbi:MAG: IS630 transposase-related protein [Prevotella sp.]|jgi:transposase|nr:IS630 transposase-related protein [Prevotella sp.]
MDLRTRVMNDIAAGLSLQKTADKYNVSRQWIQILKKRLRETGSYEAKPLQGVAGRKRKLKKYQEELKEIVTETPDATLEELAEQLPIKVSTSMVYRELQHLKLTYKKNSVCRRTRPTGCRPKTSGMESEASRFEP